MGFANSCQRKLNLDRRAAKKQRAKQQSQVQIIRHDEWITRNGLNVKWFFSPLRAEGFSLPCHRHPHPNPNPNLNLSLISPNEVKYSSRLPISRWPFSAPWR
jgi:hypothetical protein